MISKSLVVPSAAFTFEVEHLIFNAGEASKVSVTLKEVFSSDKESFFSASYITPPNGQVIVYEVASILENRLEQNGKSNMLVECSAQGDSLNDVCTFQFRAFYCKRFLPIRFADFDKKRFLTTALSRLTTKDAIEYLHVYNTPQSGGSNVSYNPLRYTLTALIKTEDGTIQNWGSSYPVGNELITKQYSYERILATIPTIPANCQFVGYKIRIGSGPEYSFYFTDRKPARMFYFLNCFNVYELAIIPSGTNLKLETKYSTAICAETTSQYDVEHSRSYESQSSALLITQAAWLTQFLTSPDIRLYTGNEEDDFGDMPKVLIKDYDIELSDEPGQVNSFKFEWQFANEREMLNPLDGFESPSRIFTEQFSNTFA